jgi:hypothetical protein
VRFLLVLDLLIVISTVLLEWHYVVDLLGGALVAALSVLLAVLEHRDVWREERFISKGSQDCKFRVQK